MNLNEISANSFSYIGDAYYSLKVREYLIKSGHQRSIDLQKLANHYVSAKAQFEIFTHLETIGFFTEEELGVYKRGRNHIGHIPKNGDLKTYQVASGLEAIVGYLYLIKSERLEELFKAIFDWRQI
ncbi:MAG: Mini-ribonuclease 3 [Erysipelotrichaceae bacterium]|jgi:ribonuclease-3 family protein|nr:Mini-ribonuclease 3 [Erysipelotrichaceae bacterium]